MDTSFTYLTLNDPTSSITRRKAHHDMFPRRIKVNIFYRWYSRTLVLSIMSKEMI